MTEVNFQEINDSISNGLRLKTLPVAVKFLKDESDFPEKTRQPSVVLQKRVTICQAVTMARVYGLSLIHISEPTRPILVSRMPSSA